MVFKKNLCKISEKILGWNFDRIPQRISKENFNEAILDITHAILEGILALISKAILREFLKKFLEYFQKAHRGKYCEKTLKLWNQEEVLNYPRTKF